MTIQLYCPHGWIDRRQCEPCAIALERDSALAEIERLKTWIDSAFDAHPNLDLDIKHERNPEIKWLPIKSMPDEGTFLVYMPEERVKIHTCWINRNGVMIIGGMFAFDLTKPTYWMSLPPPPTE